MLNADPQNERNLLHAFGVELQGKPRSIPIHSVFARLAHLEPDFKPNVAFCEFFIIGRNDELHTSEPTFDGLPENKWLAPYYKACKALCTTLKKTLADYLNKKHEKTAEKLIKALESEKLGEVKKKIAAHKKVFESKDQEVREQITGQQLLLSKMWFGNRSSVECPACSCVAKIAGDLETESEPQFKEGELEVIRTYLASRLECGGCGLVLKGLEELLHAEVEPQFRKTVSISLHDYAQPEYEEEYNNM